MERSHSGLVRGLGKLVYLNRYRGFESLPLRQKFAMDYLKIPHVKQNGDTHCGVACLEMVYKYFAINDITQDDIWQAKKSLRPDKTDFYMRTADMVDHLVENNFQVLYGQLLLDEVLCVRSISALLNAGIPIIACKQSDADPKYGHFVIIVGIESGSYFYYLDPNKSSSLQKKSVKKFIKEWRESGEEVTGGEFIIVSKEAKTFPVKKIHLTSFQAPKLESFTLATLDYRVK